MTDSVTGPEVAPTGTGTNPAPRVAWVHIGMGKTGTTAIQERLWLHREHLAAKGICYPDLGHEQHLPAVRTLAAAAGSPAVFPGGGLQLSVAELRERIEAQMAGKHTLLLSSEFWFDYPALTGERSRKTIDTSIGHLHRTAAQTVALLEGYDVRVVAWLRRQDRWLMGMWNNVVKSDGSRQRFPVFVNRAVAPELARIIEGWADVVGKGNITLRSYDTLMARKGDVVADYCAIVGLDPADVPPPESAGVKAGNPSLAREAFELQLHANQLLDGRSLDELRQAAFLLDARLRAAGRQWPHDIASPQERRALIEPFLEGNRQLARDYGDDLDALTDLSDLDDMAWEQWPGLDPELRYEYLVRTAGLITERLARLEGRINQMGGRQQQLARQVAALTEAVEAANRPAEPVVAPRTLVRRGVEFVRGRLRR